MLKHPIVNSNIIQKSNPEYWIYDIPFAESFFLLNFDNFFFLSQSQWCPHHPALTPWVQTLSMLLCWSWCVSSFFC